MIRDVTGVWLELPDGGQIPMAPGVLVIAPWSWFWAPAEQFESSKAGSVLRLEDRASGAEWTYLAPRVRWVTHAWEPSDDG